MNFKLTPVLLAIAVAITISSCTTSKKRTTQNGRVIIVEDSRSVRVANSGNGRPKGWYKNTNNPHHPRTTNPGHTKFKGKPGQPGKSAQQTQVVVIREEKGKKKKK